MGIFLIVDDEKSIRITMKAFLERDGHQVATAASVPEALQLLQMQTIDVVFTDIIMPRMSGVELLGESRQIAPDVPVIIMTGEPTVDTAIQAVQLGAFDYISKPTARDELLKVARQALQLRKALKEKHILESQNQAYQENLEKMVRKRTGELERAIQGTINVLISLVETRDPYTAGHQRRVGNLAAAIAGEMGLPERTIAGLRITGYLHDIGKISVPSEILVKPTRLSFHEFEIVKTHTLTGYEILREIDFTWPVADTVLQHHERMDGSGYPNGLRRKDITQEGGILAVADVVEAMASHRPYRPSLGLDAALEEIVSKRSVHFREDVADACIRLFRDHQYVIEDDFTDSSILFDA